MLNEIRYSKQAAKFLDKQPLKVREYIISAIDKIPEGDMKKLQSREGYRLRAGSYRIIFDRHGCVIFVSKIDSRRDVYKGGVF